MVKKIYQIEILEAINYQLFIVSTYYRQFSAVVKSKAVESKSVSLAQRGRRLKPTEKINFIIFFAENCLKNVMIHDFSVWHSTDSNTLDINRFRMNTRKDLPNISLALLTPRALIIFNANLKYCFIKNLLAKVDQGFWGNWDVFYTIPQSLIVSLTQQLWGLKLKFYWLVHSVECQNVSKTYCNLQMG